MQRPSLITPRYIRTDKRGTFIEVLNGGRWESVIYGKMKRGSVLGNHYHKKTRIFFYLLKGNTTVDIVHVRTGRRKHAVLREHQGIMLEVNESHAIRFIKRSEFMMLKSLRYDQRAPDTYAFPVEG
jgi:dTDP-4-dehydrorhamnose 3,5-epimerase-like enzyme